MANKYQAYLDNLAAGILNPKGNLGDFAHAQRLFIDNNLKLAPKQKHLYHVFFKMNSDSVGSVLPELINRHDLELGMLVKSAETPKYTAEVDTVNQYNRKKNVQTSIRYQPITIEFHDDNYGVTTALLEAYYRYYYADGNHNGDPGAFNKAGSGDSAYKGPGRNQYKFGLDNNVGIPFFQNIQISQMARKNYTTYTLVNPIITDWQHTNLASADGDIATNTITVAYEAVHYDRGFIEAGANGNPVGFGDTSHYDVTPSPLTPEGGGTNDILDNIEGALELFGYITKGTGFSNPLAAGIAATNIIGNLRELSSDGLREQGYNILTDVLGQVAGVNVSGVSNLLFPKNNGSGRELLAATAVVGLGRAVLGNTNTPAGLEAAKFNLFRQDYQANNGSGDMNEMRAQYRALSPGDQSALAERAGGGS